MNKNNPFLQYGVAIENFFNLEVWLIKIFFVLTLLSLPQMIVFASYNSNASFQESSFLDSLSFASLGQANAVCSKAPNLPGSTDFKFLFACSKNYEITEFFSMGLVGYSDSGNATTLLDSLSEIQSVCMLEKSQLRDLTY